MTTKLSASISRLMFSGRNSFEFSPNDKILLVGPNNSGKSQSLRDIYSIASRGERAQTLVVRQMNMRKSGSADDLKKYLESEADFSNDTYRYKDWQLHTGSIVRWDQPYTTRDLAPGFIKNITADDRLAICQVQASISPTDQKSKPQHVLYDDSDLMSKLSELFKRSFGKDIIFDFRGGSTLPIHVGELPMLPGVVDRVADDYVKAVRSNPLLHEQGDGMKSYAGILFEAIVANRDITLIDEPEAYLHPPQMRQLGETLAAQVRGQLVVATHSSDIMRGFLEGTKGGLRILRIRREASVNIVGEAPSEVVRELWENPLLRYSNALEGIFHEQTIVCEDDSDCRLLNSVGDHLAANGDRGWQDTAYVPTGGKDRIPDVAKVLRAVGVPVKAVFDIDFLSNRKLVKSTVEEFGGKWSDVEPCWRRVDSAVRDGVECQTVEEIKRSLVSIVQEAEEGTLPKGIIIEAMKQDKPWKIVKQFGKAGIPPGEAQQYYNELSKQLEEIGPFDSCGELLSRGGTTWTQVCYKAAVRKVFRRFELGAT